MEGSDGMGLERVENEMGLERGDCAIQMSRCFGCLREGVRKAKDNCVECREAERKLDGYSAVRWELKGTVHHA